MELSQLQPTTLVEHQELGIGRIAEVEHSQVVVAFLSEPGHQMSASRAQDSLITRPEGGLAALLYDNPHEEVTSWVLEGPLRLCGAALADLDGSGKGSDLKGKLETILLLGDAKWSDWWRVVEPHLKGSEYFQVEGKTYSLADECQGAKIPVKPLSQQVKPSGGLTRNRKALARSIWGAYEKNAPITRAVLENLTKRLDPQEQEVLREAIAQVAFPPGKLRQPTRRLERILSIFPRESAPAGGIQRIIWEAVSGGVSASVGHEQIEEIKRELSEERNRRRSYEEQLAREQRDQESLRQSYEKRLAQEEANRETLRQSYEEQLQRTRSDWNKQVQLLRDEIAANREESRLDIRRDMLTAVADALHNLRRQNVPQDNLLRDAEAGLEIALLAGGVKWYGTVGEQVEYNPRLHQGVDSTLTGTPVTVTERGALVPGERTGDFILIKAQVKRQPEGN